MFTEVRAFDPWPFTREPIDLFERLQKTLGRPSGQDLQPPQGSEVPWVRMIRQGGLALG